MNQRIPAVLLMALAAPCIAPSSADLGARVIVDREGPEERVFDEIKKDLTPRIPDGMLTATFREFDAYVDRRVTRDKKSVVLYPAILSELIRLAHGSRWSAPQTAQFLVYVQREIDDEKRSPTLLLQHIIQEMKTGRSPEQIAAGLEARENITH